MPVVIGTCRLCGVPDLELQDSHIMPKWAYRRARGDARNPVMIHDGSAVLTSRQVTEHLLCRSCEQSFSRAEKYAAEVVYQQDGSAPALSLLEPAPHPLLSEFSIVSCGRLDWTAMIYLSVSLFWRAHVSSSSPQYLLGPHAEPLRRFLRGEAAFPNTASIVLLLDRSDSRADRAFSQVVAFPVMQRKHGYFAHTLALFGFRPVLAVGQVIPRAFRRFCAAHGADKLVLLQSPTEIPFGRTFAALVRDAIPRGKARELRRPA